MALVREQPRHKGFYERGYAMFTHKSDHFLPHGSSLGGIRVGRGVKQDKAGKVIPVPLQQGQADIPAEGMTHNYRSLQPQLLDPCGDGIGDTVNGEWRVQDFGLPKPG